MFELFTSEQINPEGKTYQLNNVVNVNCSFGKEKTRIIINDVI